MTALTRGALAAAFLALGPGCFGPLRPASPASVAAAAKQVKTGGACLDLGKGEQAAYTADEFAAKAAELLAAGRQASARHFVGLYPDLCQEALRRATNTEASAASVQLIAQVHDAQTGLVGTPLSWESLVRQRVAEPGRFAAYDAGRKRATAGEATTAGLAKAAPHPLLEIDARRLVGEALLQTDQTEKAAVEFAAALKLTQPGYVYQTAQLQLLLGEAKRRSGQFDQAAGTWQQAVIAAGQLANGPAPLADPILWETASSLRPHNIAWPEQVVAALMPAAAIHRAPGADEAWLWKRVGHWRLDRGEPQAALLAFKKAESSAAEPALMDDLQVLQASALAQLGQAAAAAALLTPLVDKPRATVSAAALATLGGMKLQMAAAPQAAALLKAALDASQSADWPGRAEAEADYGLACLLTGDADTGLQNLHAAQQKFAAAGNVYQLRQCVENEAAYLRKTAKPAEADRITAQLDALERAPTGRRN